MVKIPKSVKWAKKFSKNQIFVPYLIDVRTINETSKTVKPNVNRLSLTISPLKNSEYRKLA